MTRKANPPNLSTFPLRAAARLRELRLRKYEMQDGFVAALRANGLTAVNRSTVSGWERGEHYPTIEKWPIIAETLGVKVRTLLPDE